MKKFKILLLLIAVIAASLTLTACSRSKSVNVVIPDGFVEYKNDKHKFSIHYPAVWTLLDDSITFDDIKDVILEKHGQEFLNQVAVLGFNVDFSRVAAIWFDFYNMADEFAPNVNLVIDANRGGLKQSDLKKSDVQRGLQKVFEEGFAQVFKDFTPVANITGKTLGNNYFLIYLFDTTMGDMKLSFCQAMTIIGNDMYMFTYTTHHGTLDASTEMYEQMLSTLKH